MRAALAQRMCSTHVFIERMSGFELLTYNPIMCFVDI